MIIPCDKRNRCNRICKRPCADYRPDEAACLLWAIGIILTIYLLASAVGAAITQNKLPL